MQPPTMNFVAEPTLQGVVESPAALERRQLEAIADEREHIRSVDAAAHLLKNAIADLRNHRARSGQHVYDATDANYVLLCDVLTQIELLETESQ